MVEDGVLRAVAGVVTDEEDGLHTFVDALHHREWGRGAAIEAGAPVQLLD